MSHISFSTIDLEIGGQAWTKGQTVRLKGEEGEAWACSVILGFGTSDGGKPGSWWVKLARPYVYASLTGAALTGLETYEVPAEKLTERFVRLGKQREGYSVYVTG